MKITSIEINNILSIENASLSFDENGLLLVEGWNHDTQRSNGAGKTALFNAISFALYDKIPRKITASEILRRGSTSGRVALRMVCGQDTYEVIRHRPKGVEFIKNSVRVDITQKEFEANIRLSYDQFLLTMYTAQNVNGGTDRFLLKSDTDKKTFLLRLLDLEKFSSCKKLAEGKITVLSADIGTLMGKVTNNTSKINAYTESLVDEEALHTTIRITQASIDPLVSESKQLEKVPKPDLSKYSKLEHDIRSRQDAIIQARAKKGMLHDQYRALQQTLESVGHGTCSECGSTLVTPESHKRHTDGQERTRARLSVIHNELNILDATISDEKTVANLSSRLIDKKIAESAAYAKASSSLDLLRSTIRTKEFQIDALARQIAANASFQSKIDVLNESNKETEVSIASKKCELQMYEIIAGIYSPTGAQAYILDSVVDLFNETIGDFISIMWPNASYAITSYKENSKGEMVAKFSETLMMGNTEVSVGSLSGGEFKALSLCVDFAILDILSKQFGLDLNPIILDEPFDGLDSAGKAIVIKLLAKLADNKQIVVVDHATEAKSLFPKVLLVEKRSSVTTISIET